MKKIAIACAAVFALGGAAAADPVFGVWQSPKSEGGASIQVKMSACGSKVCGTIVSVRNGDDSVKGKRMIWDMKANGGGSYSGGKVWAPDDDKTYKGKLDLSGNTLKISGCVLAGTICRGSDFKRVK